MTKNSEFNKLRSKSSDSNPNSDNIESIDKNIKTLLANLDKLDDKLGIISSDIEKYEEDMTKQLNQLNKDVSKLAIFNEENKTKVDSVTKITAKSCLITACATLIGATLLHLIGLL